MSDLFTVDLPCVVCGRRAGDTRDRCCEIDDGTPLGPVEYCELCGQPVCPDCLHEGDCCQSDGY